MKTSLVSVVVPAYKQEKTIITDLKRIKQVLDALRYATEIIVVVDGAVDKTFTKVSKFIQSNPGVNIKVVGYKVNRGKGFAVRFGMARAKGEIIGFVDSGMDLNPNGISMMLEHFEWYRADVVVGSKRHPASKVSYPWQRKVLSYGYQFLAWVLFGLHVKDTQVGMKFFRRTVVKKVLPRVLVKAFAFDIEMLAVANYLGYRRIYEAPVEIRLNFGGASTLTNQRFLKTVILMIWDTLSVFYRLYLVDYYSDANRNNWRSDLSV